MNQSRFMNAHKEEKLMFERTSKCFPILLLAVLTTALSIQGALGSDKSPEWKPGSHNNVVNATDDWLPGLPTGEIFCSEGIIDLTNPLVPVCPPGSTIEFRNVAGYSIQHADEPLLAGLMTYVSNGSLGAFDFAGPVWGTWTLETEACDGSWEGTWSGYRSFVPGQSNPMDSFLPPPGFGGVWIGSLDLRGSGDGECLERLHVKGVEIITTLTPMPIPYEMILPCDLVGCLPEGVSSARVLGPWRP